MSTVEAASDIFYYGHQLLPSSVWLWLVCIGAFVILTLISLKFYSRRLYTSFENLPVPSLDGHTGPDVVIIGSGILGSALAATLAKDGRKVTVIERDLAEPDRIVGELLQPGGRRALEELGLQDCTEHVDAHTIKGYVIHENKSKTQVLVPYPEDKSKPSERVTGRAFHHGRFVMALRSAAKEEKNVTYIEGTASKLIDENGVITGVTYRDKTTSELKTIHAPLTVVADGCFSKFRKNLVCEVPTTKSHFVGMIMNHCPQAKTNHAELVLADPSPILIYQISSTNTRVLVDVRGGMPKDIKDYLKQTVYSQLPEHIQDSFLDAVETGRIRSMPNSFLPPSPVEKPGVLVLGDAFNMRHPLTGGGMSVALNDVVIWRHLLREIADFRDYNSMLKALRSFHLNRKNRHSFVVNILAQALYELFAANDDYLGSLKDACFEYFKLGGECVNGPVGLLSVISPKPHILIGHFFAVAVFAIYITFRSEKWYSIHKAFWKSACIFWKACQVIFPLIWSEVKPIFV